MVPPRLTVVTLGARDMARMRSFYQALDWAELPGGSDDWAAYLLGGTLLTLYPFTALSEEAVLGDPPAGPGGFTLACNVDERDDVDRAFGEAVAAGAQAVAEPEDRFWGGRSGYVADPEGNRWEIAWAPMAVFDERGVLLRFGGEESDRGNG